LAASPVKEQEGNVGLLICEEAPKSVLDTEIVVKTKLLLMLMNDDRCRVLVGMYSIGVL
jgi:hypothetical protein